MKTPRNFIVKFAYFLDASTKYNSIKTFFYNLLENDNYPYKKYFDFFMIFVILSSVTLLVIDVKHHVPKWLDALDLYFVTTVFVVEYILRMWVYSDVHKIVIEEYEEALFFSKSLKTSTLLKKIFKDKWEYITTPSAIIDLIAILPSYRGLRVLRVLVLFRAFKMLRYTKSLTSFLEVLKNKKFELITLLTLSGFFIFIAGIMLYVFEGNNQNPNIKNLFDSFYWALITISTVGYGDISPVTPEGRVVTMLIIFTGIGLISFATSIIVSSFSERLTMLREDRIVQHLSKKESITVICGFGLLGRLVAKELEREGVAFVVIEKDENLAEMAYGMGYKAICADATSEKVFSQLKIKTNISHVLCLTSDDIVNIFIAVNVKSLNPNVHVSARCSDEEVAQKMYFANVDQVIMPEEIAGMMAAVYEGEPVAFEVLLSIVDQKDKIQMDEIEITPQSFGDGKKLQEVEIEAMRVILLGVLRNCKTKDSEFIFNPSDDFILRAGDNLVCIGHVTAISNLKRKMQ